MNKKSNTLRNLIEVALYGVTFLSVYLIFRSVFPSETVTLTVDWVKALIGVALLSASGRLCNVLMHIRRREYRRGNKDEF